MHPCGGDPFTWSSKRLLQVAVAGVSVPGTHSGKPTKMRQWQPVHVRVLATANPYTSKTDKARIPSCLKLADTAVMYQRGPCMSRKAALATCRRSQADTMLIRHNC